MKERYYSDTENLYKGYSIEIYQDELAEDPRRMFDPMGKMICFHSRYELGDKHDFYDPEDFYKSLAAEVLPNIDELIDYIESDFFSRHADRAGEAAADKRAELIIDALVNMKVSENFIVLPLYLYDHSGLAMSVNRFFCPWDSGQVGYIYLSHEDAKKEYADDDDGTAIEKATRYLAGEVREYSAYLEGDVFGFTITDPDGEIIDGCAGFYGFDANADYVAEEIRNTIDADIRRRRKEKRQEAAAANMATIEAERLEAETDQFIKTYFAL